MKEFERKEFEKMEKLAAEIERNPMTAKFREQEAAEILRKRKLAAAKIEDLKLDIEATQIIQGEIDEMNLKLANLDIEREKIKVAIAGKKYFMMKEKFGAEGAMRQEQEILFSCYDPAIDEAIIFFRDKLDDLRKPGRISSNVIKSEFNIFTFGRKTKAENNKQAVNDALKYCQNAIIKLDEMKLCPELDLTGIEKMKTGIPRIDVYQEVTGERAAEKINDDPRSLLPSDSEIAWSLKKVDEKFKKIMKRY